MGSTLDELRADNDRETHSDRWWGAAVLTALAGGGLAFAGYGALGLLMVGGTASWVAVAAAGRVIRWFDAPHGEGAELWWEFLLLLLVVIAFGGLVLMALALPN